jgi:hypothetical protein
MKMNNNGSNMEKITTEQTREFIQQAWSDFQYQRNSQAFAAWYQASVDELKKQQGSDHGS